MSKVRFGNQGGRPKKKQKGKGPAGYVWMRMIFYDNGDFGIRKLGEAMRPGAADGDIVHGIYVYTDADEAIVLQSLRAGQLPPMPKPLDYSHQMHGHNPPGAARIYQWNAKTKQTELRT